MKFFKWREGRQKTDYNVMLLAEVTWPLPMDCYIIKYPDGAGVPPHRDKVENGRHFRINFIVTNPNTGGEFICDKVIFQTKRIKFFRPDLYYHEVNPCYGKTRYVFSIGWVLPQRAIDG